MATNHRGQPIGNPNTPHGGSASRPMGRSDLPRLSKALMNSTNEDLSAASADLRYNNPMVGYTSINLEPYIDEHDANHMLRRYREDRAEGEYGDMPEAQEQISRAIRRRGRF